MKKVDRVFTILLVIQIVIIFIFGFIDVSELLKTLSFVGIISTISIWYMLTLKNKTNGK